MRRWRQKCENLHRNIRYPCLMCSRRWKMRLNDISGTSDWHADADGGISASYWKTIPSSHDIKIYVARKANFGASWLKLTLGKYQDILYHIEILCVWKIGVDPTMMCTVHKFLPMSKWASECFFLSDTTYITTQMSCPANIALAALTFQLLLSLSL